MVKAAEPSVAPLQNRALVLVKLPVKGVGEVNDTMVENETELPASNAEIV